MQGIAFHGGNYTDRIKGKHQQARSALGILGKEGFYLASLRMLAAPYAGVLSGLTSHVGGTLSKIIADIEVAYW